MSNRWGAPLSAGLVETNDLPGNGLESCAGGVDSQANKGGSTALGYGAHANELESTAVGHNADASGGPSATAIGSTAAASDDYATAVGAAAAAAANSVAVGAGSSAAGGGAGGVSIGKSASSVQDGTAVGATANASGTSATAVGDASLASGLNTVAVGFQATANGSYGVAVGVGSTAGQNAVAIGFGATAATDEVVVGQIKSSVTANAVFLELPDGQSAAVSPANKFRFRYNQSTQKVQASENGGAYADVIGGMAIGDVIASGDAGSLLFVGAGPVLAQDNANLFWDYANKRLGINAIGAPSYVLDARGSLGASLMGLINTDPTGNSATDFFDNSVAHQGTIGYANVSSATAAWVRGLLYTWSTGPDWVYANGTGNAFRFGMTNTAAFLEMADGGTAPVSSTGKGRFRYVGGVGPEFSSNGGAYHFLSAQRAGGISSGSVLYMDASGYLNQDTTANNQFFWDATNHRLGIGTASPLNKLHIDSVSSPTIGQFRMTAGGLGSLSMLSYTADNHLLGFDIDYDSGFIARHATIAGIYKIGGFLNFQGGAGNSVNGTPTDNVNILRLDLTNKYVGVGTATPGYQFDMRTATTGKTSFHLRSGAVTDDGGYMAATTGTELMFSAGAMFDGTNFIAKHAAGSFLALNTATLAFYGDTSLTIGNSFSPTVRMTVYPAGGLELHNSGSATVSVASAAKLRYSSGALQVSKSTAAYEDVASLATAQTFTKSQNVAAVALTDAATIATDASLGNVFTDTLTDNRTLGAPTNLVAGGRYTWIFTQDGVGSRTLTYNGIFKWPGGTAPTLSTAAGAIDKIEAVYDGTNLLTTFALAFA